MYKQVIKSGVRKLRSNGQTFNEIRHHFPELSKSTISTWVRDIKLNQDQEKRILKKQLRGRSALILYNKLSREKAAKTASGLIQAARDKVGILKSRDLLIAGAALYSAEGHTKGRYQVEVANSNPFIISLMMRFFREILKIPEEKFRCGLILHPEINEGEAIKFWSDITRIPRSQFTKPYTKPPKTTTGKMHNILYNGTAKVRICDIKKLWELKGYISGLLNSDGPVV
ncbi:MAG TPA: hypothetical protein VJZ52_00565 [Candidatus Paceibacterota bacterium]|nr:hypothetical protein [Candidatus Paceibacterota bacterium]